MTGHPSFPAAGCGRRIVAKLGGFFGPAMRIPALAFAVLLAIAGLAGQAQAQGYSRPAQRVISQAFAATGGSGWRLLRGWRETGVRDGVPYESWIDPVRYGLRIETQEADGLHIFGFNGQAVWRVMPSGAMTAVNDHEALAAARTEAFFAAGCWLFPGRFDARGDYVGVRRMRGRAYDVLRVQPWNGQPRELWFDQRSHLLARIVDPGAPRPAVQVSDYRKVGPVLVAFRYAPEGGGAGGLLVRQRETLAFTPSDRDLFSLNRPEALAKVQRGALSTR